MSVSTDRGLLCEWKANDYLRKQAELRKRLAAAKTVGEAEIKKLEMAPHEEGLSYIGYALTAYARADRERSSNVPRPDDDSGSRERRCKLGAQ
jgi:hypothetical protein